MDNTIEKLTKWMCDALETDECIGHCNHPPCYRVKFAVDNLIANGVTVQKWIPVTERLPEVAIIHKSRWEQSTESVHVLCACKQKSGKRMVKEGSCKVYASGTIYWMIPGTVDSVTHWMPLPQPPKEG